SGPLNGQFPHQQGQLQPGHPQLQGPSMSPSNSRAGPSPQMANLELSQQKRKPGQKTASGGATPEPDPASQLRGPSPAFAGQNPMTPDQYHQMAQMGGYQQGIVIGQNGQPQFVPSRPHPNMGFQPTQNPMAVDLMKRMPPQGGQAGQPYPAAWQMVNQPM